MTFEEEYPSLKDKRVIAQEYLDADCIPTEDVEEFCLDKERFKELDKIFYSVPQPTCLIEKWESKKKELKL